MDLEVVERAQRLAPILKERAFQTEKERHVPSETVQD